MCPAEARIFFFEDDKSNVEITSKLLERAGHKVIGSVTSLAEALDIIPNLEKIGTQVAIVDGNLSEDDTSGSDGETIAQAIHAQCPTITVIGYATNQDIINADVNCRKTERIEELIKTVTNA